MRVFVTTPPDPVVSLDEAKAHLRVEHSDDDALITGFVAAASGHIDGPDGWLGRSIGVQVLEARCSLIECSGSVALPFPPVIDLEGITFRVQGEADRVIDLGDVELAGPVVYPTGASFPWDGGSLRAEALRIRYRAGYESLPPAIRAAILLMTEDLYRNRGEAVIGAASVKVAMSATVDALLGPFRVWR